MQSKLFQKNAYGLDQSGEVADEAQKNIEDTSEPQDHHETEHNTVNLTGDAVAEKEFPSLGRHQVKFPARTD